MAASMASSSLPAWPTKGSPRASSSAPGPSPMNSQSAFSSPTPATACLRSLHSAQARHAAMLWRSCSQFCCAICPARSSLEAAVCTATAADNSSVRGCGGTATGEAGVPRATDGVWRSIHCGDSPISASN